MVGRMKICISCDQPKPLTEFYKHPQMADGYLGKCKDCQKKNTKEARERNPEHYKKYDQERAGTDKRKRAVARYHATHKPLVNEIKKRWIQRNPEKRKAHHAVSNAIRDGKLKRQLCEVCGKKAQAHHDDYSKPLQVRWLCTHHHKQADQCRTEPRSRSQSSCEFWKFSRVIT